METGFLYTTSGCGLITDTSMWLMFMPKTALRRSRHDIRGCALVVGEGLMIDIMPFHVLPDIERPTYISAS